MTADLTDRRPKVIVNQNSCDKPHVDTARGIQPETELGTAMPDDQAMLSTFPQHLHISIQAKCFFSQTSAFLPEGSHLKGYRFSHEWS